MRGGGDPPWILGLSLSHNGAACLMRGGEIVVAVQEERLWRSKRTRIVPGEFSLAVQYCLGHAGITPADLAAIGVCSQPALTQAQGSVLLEEQLAAGRNGVPVSFLSHHAGHAVHAFATSGFSEAAVLVVDGMGSPGLDLSEAERGAVIDGSITAGGESISLYHAVGTQITALEKHLTAKSEWLIWGESGMPRFRSLGGMYSAVAHQLFGAYMEAGHVMGMAAYGAPDIPASDFFVFENGCFRFKDDVPGRFNHDIRWPQHEREYEHLSASVQSALEEAVLGLASRLAEKTGSPNLCYSGGVALNVTTNERLHRETGFRDIYVPAAAEDSGPAIGAAFHALWELTGRHAPVREQCDSYGHSYTSGEVDAAIKAVPGLQASIPADVLEECAARIARGEICGWFHGGSELGPRALGNRSILADPRDPDTRERLNRKVKFRQPFRPFAPAILKERAAEWFELPAPGADSPFMLRSWPVRNEVRARVPSIVHADGTGRAQTIDAQHLPRFHALISKFDALTGVPILVNTSFNVNREPIVETPEDALWCFLMTDIDFCVLEDRLVTKAAGRNAVLAYTPHMAALNIVREEEILRCRLSSPWGERDGLLPADLLPVLELIDGKTRVDEIAAKLAKAASQPAPPEAMIELFVKLRRLRIIGFKADEPVGL